MHAHTHCQVFQLGVQLQPSSSDALCHLGNSQLVQFEATNEQRWLADAELSFRASIEMEGKAIIPTIVPEQLCQQEWWKKQHKDPAAKDEGTKKPAAAAAVSSGQTQPKQTPAGKQPATARGKQAPQPARAQPSGGGRGPVTKPAAGRGQGPTAAGAGRKTAASRQQVGPAKPGQRVVAAANVKGGASGKTVATLGELKSGAAAKKQNGGTVSSSSSSTVATEKAPPTEAKKDDVNSNAGTSETTKAAEVNKKSYHPRLGLARTLAKNSDQKKQEESHGYYREVIDMAPQVHDAYIELGEILAKSDPVAAVDVYAKFPFNDPPTFDDAFLHGEIVRLLMKSESYDNPRLCTSLIAMGKALGIGVLEKQVSILEGKFQSKLLKQVYAGVHGKSLDDPELQAFFKFKCWL